MLHDMSPVAAMKASFRGCMRNIVPFLVYGILMLAALVRRDDPAGTGPAGVGAGRDRFDVRGLPDDLHETAAPTQPAMAKAALDEAPDERQGERESRIVVVIGR